MHPASPNGEHITRRRRIPIPRRLEPAPLGELTRWRIDFLGYLRDLDSVTRAGASEAHLKRRLEALVRALENRLDQARRSA